MTLSADTTGTTQEGPGGRKPSPTRLGTTRRLFPRLDANRWVGYEGRDRPCVDKESMRGWVRATKAWRAAHYG